jgi:tellurite resistance protein TerC
LWGYLAQTQSLTMANVKAMEFLAGYLIELSLSVDNVFVFLMIFTYFNVPLQYQRRVLLLGILGAIVMRLIMILLGVWLIQEFHWFLYLFGVFLVFTGIKMWVNAQRKIKTEISQSIAYQLLQRFSRIDNQFHQERFFVRINGLLYATPLFVVLVLIEFSDLVFAIDSIPAIFAVTEDPFIIFTSNIFAILGLRALYFLLAQMAGRFYLVKYGLAIILIFIGCKMLLAIWFTIPIFITLPIIILTLAFSVLLSVKFPRLMENKKR